MGQDVKDASLGSGSQAKKQRLLQEAYQKYCKKLSFYIQKKYGTGPPEPEDVAQDAFTKFASLEHPADIENPEAFLFVTARNIVLDHKRRQKTRDTYAQHAIHRDVEEQSDDFSPEHVLIVRERLKIVVGVLTDMPKKRRRLLLLNHLDGLGFTEIGRRLGMSESGVRKQVKHAVADCMTALKTAEQSREGNGK